MRHRSRRRRQGPGKPTLTAVAEAKGRITKSELKQHAAGQFEAILHFEVAPADADMVRERLKKLGIVTHQDGDRTEQTEGAGTQTPDIKIKKHDVKFEVGMYNSANIQPREVLVIQIASLDVPAGFRKLQEAAAKAKGQVRTGQLNEQDKLNVSAQFDFDVPSVEKKAIDQALAEVGKVISRAATQAAPGETATDRKVGYRLTLRNVAALPSREKVSLGIEVKDVDQTVTDILDMVKTRQGHIAGAQMNHGAMAIFPPSWSSMCRSPSRTNSFASSKRRESCGSRPRHAIHKSPTTSWPPPTST